MPKTAPTVSDEDIRRKYYEAAGYSMWITEMQLDPLQLVVCDDATGKYFRVPVALAKGEFSFGEPIEVAVQYIDAAAAHASSAIVWASRVDSLAGMPTAPTTPPTPPAPPGPPKDPQTPPPPAPDPTFPGGRPAAPKETPAQAAARMKAAADKARAAHTPDAAPATGPTSTEGAPSMGAAETILEALGLSPDATREQVTAALTALRTGPAGSTDLPPAAPGTPDADGKSLADLAKMAQDTGVVLIDKAQLAEMVSMAKQGADAAKRMRENERDGVIEKACKEGKIPLARVDHWRTAWDKDSEGTRSALDSLAPNMIPVEVSGYAGRADFALSEADVAYTALYGKEG